MEYSPPLSATLTINQFSLLYAITVNVCSLRHELAFHESEQIRCDALLSRNVQGGMCAHVNDGAVGTVLQQELHHGLFLHKVSF